MQHTASDPLRGHAGTSSPWCSSGGPSNRAQARREGRRNAGGGGFLAASERRDEADEAARRNDSMSDLKLHHRLQDLDRRDCDLRPAEPWDRQDRRRVGSTRTSSRQDRANRPASPRSGPTSARVSSRARLESRYLEEAALQEVSRPRGRSRFNGVPGGSASEGLRALGRKYPEGRLPPKGVDSGDPFRDSSRAVVATEWRTTAGSRPFSRRVSATVDWEGAAPSGLRARHRARRNAARRRIRLSAR